MNGAKLVFCNVPARDADSVLPFYGALLGIDPKAFVANKKSPIPQYYEPVSGDGVDITITQRNDTREVTATYWHVDDIRAAIKELEAADGHLVQGPDDVPEGGYSAMLLDPEGNYVGLVQLAPRQQEYFRAGKFAAEVEDGLERRRKEARAGAERG